MTLFFPLYREQYVLRALLIFVSISLKIQDLIAPEVIDIPMDFGCIVGPNSLNSINFSNIPTELRSQNEYKIHNISHDSGGLS